MSESPHRPGAAPHAVPHADRRSMPGSRGARREERQVHGVMNVVHAVRGTLRGRVADRPDDGEAVLASEVRVEKHRGGYPTAGGLLALGVGAPDGRGAGHDASWGRWGTRGMVAVVTREPAAVAGDRRYGRSAMAPPAWPLIAWTSAAAASPRR